MLQYLQYVDVEHYSIVLKKEKINYSSCIPGYDYKKGSESNHWQARMIGQEWIRFDFKKPTRISGLQVL